MHEQSDSDVRPNAGITAGETKGVPNRVILFAIVALAAIVFIAQNREEVTIHFLFFDISSRVWVGFVISLVLGALLGALLGRWWKRRQLR
jgi:uncharacterized integral membrane protein